MAHEIVAALIIQSGRVLLGKRAATRAFFPDVWDLFGGHVEPGEQQSQTLVRELQEELNITPTQWTYLETISQSLPASPNEPSIALTFHLYLVINWSGIPVNNQPHEHSEIGWFSLAEATELRLADASYPMLFARYLTNDSNG